MKSHRQTFLIALHCEAKPWIDFYRLKKRQARPFDWYQGETELGTVDVVICGIGALAMASAVGWIGGQGEQNRIWLNLGTAGHASRSLGEIVRVHGCAASLQGRAHYPPLTATWNGDTDALLSVDSPSDHYPEGALVDMEGAAFFESALRFSSAEFVQSLKVVSDNPQQSFDQLNGKKITALMQPHVAAVDTFSQRLASLVIEQAVESGALTHFQQLEGTHSQRQMLADVLHKVAVLGLSEQAAMMTLDENSRISTVIAELNKLVDSTVPVLTEH